MSDFLESEAEESDEEFEGKKAVISDEDEEDEEEGDDLKDLIDDAPLEEGSVSGDSDEDEGKRKHSDLDDQLTDEDYDLIQENLGIKIKRKRKRIKMISDDEESDQEEDEDKKDDRDVIANELFEGDDEEMSDRPEAPPPEKDENEFGDLDEEEESDPDDFIVDENGDPISQGKKKKKHIIHRDHALQEAQDIFGVDFDFEEFEQYGDEYDEEEEEEGEDEYEQDDMDEEGETVTRKVKKTKKRTSKKSIFDVFEPSELERGLFTDLDQEIRMTDMPERFQLRGIPVKTPEDGEIEEEAEWIYKHAFITLPISSQEQGDGYSEYLQNKGPNTVGKIREALNFMRKQHLEVPFIAFYRKEYVEPELNISELWKVWQWDEKWTQLRNRKENMIALFEKMQQYQYEQNADPDEPLPDNVRALTEEDIETARNVETMEELRDVYQHFLLYYGRDIPKMKNAEKEKKERAARGETEDGEVPNVPEPQDTPLKQATRKTGYHICQDAGLDDIAKKYGLTPEQFGENLRDNYQKNEVEQYPEEPVELAGEKICSQFPNEEDVLKGVRHVVAMQIAHDPVVRQCLRQTFHERAKVTCRPTKKGLKLIDEAHPCFTFKYLTLKPVKEFRADQFLKLQIAVDEHLMTYEIVIDEDRKSNIPTYFEEIRQLYYRDEFSTLVQAWNAQRSQALERALKLILYPQMAQEIKTQLLQEAKDGIIKACCRKLYNCLKVAPYQPDHQLEDDEDFDSSEGVRVMALCYPTEQDQASFACLIDGDGEVSDYLRLSGIMKRKNAFMKEERDHKMADLDKLKDFIATKKPHIIGVATQSRNALNLVDDVRGCVAELEQENQMAPISVELVDNEEAIIFMNSNKAEANFREYPPLLRQAVSIARRLQDPLIEFAQLCNPDEDILSLKYHPLQDQVSKDELLNALYLEFVNRVNEVGVDLNRAINHPHTVPLVQFVCGIGPRKAQHILKVLKQNNGRLENRSQLVMVCNMGPKVFVNCAGFIKIDTNSIGDTTDAYVEVLDGSRVHPETYDWARKMAVDALEYDDTAEDANPAGALEEILEAPERLKDLDLDAFAEELERQGYGNKHITLYDIRAELNHRYKDMRTPYRSPSNEEKFNMLTKETPQTFYIGKLSMATVTGIAYKKPQGDQFDQANPVRNDETGLWKCPFCQKNDFPELSEVWSHFDDGSCRGSPVGVKARLDNGVQAFLPTKMISDKHVTNPEERVKVHMTIHSRITKIDIDRYQVELTCRSSDLHDKDHQWRPPLDAHYDEEAAESETKREEDKKKQKARQTYIKRVIAHPSFHNISFSECERLMVELDQGEVIIRPSSKGADHLTVTWKVDEGVCQHIDVREEDKQNEFSIGKSLWIQKEEFEDLDEIIARHINPMAAFARDILNYKYYKPDIRKRELMEEIVITEKKKYPSKIPYYFTTSSELPGKFMLSYLPRRKPIHEFCTVTPDGIKYRGQVFPTLNSVIKWFKEHFRDPVPGMSSTPGSAVRTPAGMGPSPSINLRGIDAATLRRAAGLPSYGNLMGSTPRQTPIMAGTPSQTPQAYQTSKNFPGGFAAGYEYNQTPQMTTPMITTPSYHTSGRGGMGVPGHYQQTPKQQQQWQGATPQRAPGSTPQRVPGSTPQHRAPGSTPQHRSSGSTPKHHSSGHRSTPNRGGQTPTQRSSHRSSSSRQSTPSTNKPSTSQDWAKMAEQWAKKREREQNKDPDGPQGDATPLIDER